jgi:hypothetical protein
MKRLLIAAMMFIAVFAGGVSADTTTPAPVPNLDISKLTPEQQKALTDLAGTFTTDQSKASTILDALKNVTIDQTAVSGWAQAGTEAGKAVVNFTDQVKLPAADFMNSFVGQMIFLVLFMNYGGGKLASFGVDIGIFIVLTPIYLMFMHGVFRRFVLHMRIDENKRWLPIRSKKEGDELIVNDKDMPPVSVDMWEAFLGYFFIVITSMIYLHWLWPTWAP